MRVVALPHSFPQLDPVSSTWLLLALRQSHVDVVPIARNLLDHDIVAAVDEGSSEIDRIVDAVADVHHRELHRERGLVVAGPDEVDWRILTHPDTLRLDERTCLVPDDSRFDLEVALAGFLHAIAARRDVDPVQCRGHDLEVGVHREMSLLPLRRELALRAYPDDLLDHWLGCRFGFGLRRPLRDLLALVHRLVDVDDRSLWPGWPQSRGFGFRHRRDRRGLVDVAVVDAESAADDDDGSDSH